MTAGPVFIGGPHRSGTGMMRAILGSNSQLALPPKEYQYFDRLPLAAAPGDMRDPAAALAAVLQWPKVREWGVSLDLAALLASMSALTPAALYAAPLRAYARAHGKPRWGEKTPYLERHFETLLGWFGPGIRFVHMLRAPLPTFTSLCHQYGTRQPLDPIVFARRWRASVLRGRDYARRFPHQYLVVPYEEFVASPHIWAERLCAFCALPPEIDAMLAMRDFDRKRNSSFSGDADAAAQPAIAIDANDRQPQLPAFSTWLLRRELGPLYRGWEVAERSSAADAIVDDDRPAPIWRARINAAINRLA